MVRVLQADSDRHFLDEVESYFNRLPDFRYSGGFDNSYNLLKKIEDTCPDVLLIGLDLSPLGGVDVLRDIRYKLEINKPIVIMISTELQSDAIIQEMPNLGADYYVLRPVDLVVLENRIRQILKINLPESARKVCRNQVHETCERYFYKMGIPPHYKGYRYLMEGIWLAIKHPFLLNSVTKDLYPAIGEKYNTSSAQVERTMRYALDKTWEEGNVKSLYEFFPYEISKNKGKPTNSAFIAKMVELVSLEIR